MDLSWTPGFVESGGERVYFEVSEGPDPAGTVVLGHGGLGSHPVWYQQVPVLATTYRVITWDTRGFGCSTLGSGHLDVDAAVDDLLAVLEAAGVRERVHLVGQSMGGWWLTGCAFSHRDRIASLVYTNTTGGLFDPELDAAHHRATEEVTALVAGRIPGCGMPLGESPALGNRLVASDPVRAFLYQQLGSLRPTPSLVREAIRRRYDVDAFRALDIPTLVIGSTDDHFFPPGPLRAVAETMGARYVEVEGSGHSTYFEDPVAWNSIVLDWLRAPGRGR